MTVDSDYDDQEILALIASLNIADPLNDVDRRAPSPPRTPSPPAYSQLSDRHSGTSTFPQICPRTYTTPRVYLYESPTQRAQSPNWSTAGTATQGVSGARVRAFTPASPDKKQRKTNGPKKAAYVVFCGLQPGVFLTWSEVDPLVTGVPHSIFRGYTTVPVAFAYAEERGWVRRTGSPAASAISVLPTPMTDNSRNHLNGPENLDDKWYVVYRGINPGVYRSHLECQLNTVGLSNALHESVVGRPAALAKFAAARSRNEVSEVLPPQPLEWQDVFR
ncbi:hypothetical protein DFH07DRAFT_770228 [Mycena maculata]|uniref:Ribonuclease H1 N-terminal domain-containing protein n=1 Tax=Mycena maculata TaxID=230809 RepID=A0AAD7NK01_9AGAR|nr:hypothetical protein DFH07DRAFT_770228 [Mycena maculata]